MSRRARTACQSREQELMDKEVAQQVKRSREMLAKLNSGDGWRDSMPQWIGHLSTQLKLLCDAIEAASQQDTGPSPDVSSSPGQAS